MEGVDQHFFKVVCFHNINLVFYIISCMPFHFYGGKISQENTVVEDDLSDALWTREGAEKEAVLDKRQ